MPNTRRHCRVPSPRAQIRRQLHVRPKKKIMIQIRCHLYVGQSLGRINGLGPSGLGAAQPYNMAVSLLHPICTPEFQLPFARGVFFFFSSFLIWQLIAIQPES